MLTGNYVGLRAIEKEDLPELLKWRNMPEYRQFFREHRELNLENQNAWFEKIVMSDPSVRMFAIIDSLTDELIGACGLCYIDWINRNADFSIYIGRNNVYIDDKYVIDAAEVMIKYGVEELNLHRFWAEIYDFDVKKKEMFEKLGFNFEGRFKETHWTMGKWCDSLYYGLVVKIGSAKNS